MTTKSRRKPAGKPANSGAQQPAKDKKQPFVSRYIGIDTHLAMRGGSADLVDGIATERPAGRKLADDINRQCIQLNAEGYDVSIRFPHHKRPHCGVVCEKSAERVRMDVQPAKGGARGYLVGAAYAYRQSVLPQRRRRLQRHRRCGYHRQVAPVANAQLHRTPSRLTPSAQWGIATMPPAR